MQIMNKLGSLVTTQQKEDEKPKPSQFVVPDKVAVSLTKKRTKDYSMFKIKPENRTIKRVHVERLKESLSHNNRLDWRPVLVNEQHEIIDGQHRLRAAEELGIEVTYEIVKGEVEADLTDLQCSMSWSLADHFHRWCHGEKPDYRTLKNFMMKHGIDISKALSLFGEYKNKNFYEKFRGGEFKFDVPIEDLDRNVVQIKHVINFVNTKTAGSKRYLRSTNFWCALSTFLNSTDVDFDTFMKKIEMKLDLMRPATRVIDYLNLFKTIYNWKNKAPID